MVSASSSFVPVTKIREKIFQNGKVDHLMFQGCIIYGESTYDPNACIDYS